MRCQNAEAAGEPNLEPALLKAGGWVDEDPPRVTQEGLFCTRRCRRLRRRGLTRSRSLRSALSPLELTALMEEVLEPATVRDVTPLGPVEETLQALKSGGLKLAVVTNDQEQLARKQLERLGWIDYFDAGIIGADSGHGPKPEPGGVRAAIEAAGVEPSQAIMIGDAEGDMTSGRRAGCAFTVAIWPEGKPLPAGLASAACAWPIWAICRMRSRLPDGRRGAMRMRWRRRRRAWRWRTRMVEKRRLDRCRRRRSSDGRGGRRRFGGGRRG